MGSLSKKYCPLEFGLIDELGFVNKLENNECDDVRVYLLRKLQQFINN